MVKRQWFLNFCLVVLVFFVGACARQQVNPPPAVLDEAERPFYIIGPGDQLQVFVWGNSELSTTVPVRPDGRITIPLVPDLVAAGHTPSELGDSVAKELSKFIQNPEVSILVTGFVGPFDQQVRIVGAAAEPKALSFRDHMTVLDALIEVGGLTDFAAGNRTVLVRQEEDEQKRYTLRVDDLLNEGDITANARLRPGDIIIIPQSWF